MFDQKVTAPAHQLLCCRHANGGIMSLPVSRQRMSNTISICHNTVGCVSTIRLMALIHHDEKIVLSCDAVRSVVKRRILNCPAGVLPYLTEQRSSRRTCQCQYHMCHMESTCPRHVFSDTHSEMSAQAKNTCAVLGKYYGISNPDDQTEMTMNDKKMQNCLTLHATGLHATATRAC